MRWSRTGFLAAVFLRGLWSQPGEHEHRKVWIALSPGDPHLQTDVCPGKPLFMRARRGSSPRPT